jgi:hypothetical protein
MGATLEGYAETFHEAAKVARGTSASGHASTLAAEAREMQFGALFHSLEHAQLSVNLHCVSKAPTKKWPGCASNNLVFVCAGKGSACPKRTVKPKVCPSQLLDFMIAPGAIVRLHDRPVCNC